MIALAARDEVGALRLPDLDEVLARELQRRFDGFRAARDEIHLVEAGRRVLDEVVGQRLGHLAGEEARVRVREPVDLRVHRGEHVGVAMTKARDGGAAAGVEIASAAVVDDVHAARRHGLRRHRRKLAMQDTTHL